MHIARATFPIFVTCCGIKRVKRLRIPSHLGKKVRIAEQLNGHSFSSRRSNVAIFCSSKHSFIGCYIGEVRQYFEKIRYETFTNLTINS